MIVSHKNKFVFVAIAKTGTHAIRKALRPHLGVYDWEQCVLYEDYFFPQPSIRALNHGHISILQAEPLLPKPVWSSYFKFCFIREPINRFLSYAYFINRENDKMSKEPYEEMHRILTSEEEMEYRILLKPQIDFIKNSKDEIDMDFIGRFEQLNADFDIVTNTLLRRNLRLNRINFTPSVKVKINDEIGRLIEKYYVEDFALIDNLKLIDKPFIR